MADDAKDERPEGPQPQAPIGWGVAIGFDDDLEEITAEEVGREGAEQGTGEN